MKKLSVLAILVLFVLMGGAGCSLYHSEVKIEKEFSGEAIQQKDVNLMITAADEVKMSAEAIKSLTEKVEEEIKKQGWAVIKETDLTVQVNITKYQVTSAFSRWLIGTTGGASVALIIEGKITFLNRGEIILVVDVVARNSYAAFAHFADMEGVQEKFATEVVKLLGQIKK